MDKIVVALLKHNQEPSPFSVLEETEEILPDTQLDSPEAIQEMLNNQQLLEKEIAVLQCLINRQKQILNRLLQRRNPTIRRTIVTGVRG